ncbi:MAG: methylaspartate mutase, partial [Planctomycetaceae bacterium]
PAGTGKPGKRCFSFQISGEGIDESGEVEFGQMQVLSLADGVLAQAVIEPARGFDAGEGDGKPVEREIRGGSVGVILDGRGRPLTLPEDRDACRRAVVDWNQVQGLAELN